MKRNTTWKLFLLSCVSLLFLPGAWKLAQACGWGWEEPEESMYNQEMTCDDFYKPFYYTSYARFYDGDPPSDYNSLYRSENVNEWRSYMKNVPAAVDVDSLVYGASLEALEALEKNAAKKNAVPVGNLAGNSAAKYLLAARDARTLAYLVFARKCEKHAMTGAYYDWQLPVRDTADMLRLMKEAEQVLAKTKNSFLRERYAFQVLRLARYSGRPGDCVTWCDKYFSLDNTTGTIARRALSVKGGALRDLNRNQEARYIFAMLFDRYYPEEDWGIYANSFKFCSYSARQNPKEKGDYPFCKNNHERAVMIALDKMTDGANPGEAIEQVYKLEPSSKYLDVLLVREMQQLADGVFPFSYGAQAKPDYSASRRRIRDALRGGGLHCPQIWEFAAGYIAYLQADYTDADSWFNKAERTAGKDSVMRDQIGIMRIVQDVEQLSGISRPQENTIYEQLKKLDNVCPGAQRSAIAAKRKIMGVLAGFYEKQGETPKATICSSLSGSRDSYYGNDILPSAEYPIDEMIGFLEKNDKSPFENLLADLYALKLSQLYEQKGMDALAERQYKTAAGWFAKGTGATLEADPFVIHINDCHDCDYRDEKQQHMTRKAFAEKMAQLEVQANISGPKQMDYCYKYANGLYNMTYYGNCWQALADGRNHGSYVTDNKARIESEHMDCSEALKYYEKAMRLARNPEFAARSCFMAAKCEQNLYYISSDYQNVDDSNYERYFTLLRDSYGQTEFYGEAIRECGNFSSFTTK